MSNPIVANPSLPTTAPSCSSCHAALDTSPEGTPIGASCESCGAPFCWQCLEGRHLAEPDLLTFFVDTILVLDGLLPRAERESFIRCGCQS